MLEQSRHPSLTKVLTKTMPAPAPRRARKERVKSLSASSSVPSFITREQKKTMSLHDQCVEVFKAVDENSSGSISRRELIRALKLVGLKDSKNALELFQGFDMNSDGELSVEEFEDIAKKLLV